MRHVRYSLRKTRGRSRAFLTRHADARAVPPDLGWHTSGAGMQNLPGNPVWTDSFMRLWKSIISGICGIRARRVRARAGSMSIRVGQYFARDNLLAQIAWQPDSNLLEALDHGIPLDFVLTLKAQKRACARPASRGRRAAATHPVALYPLSRYYQFRDLDFDQTRSFPARAAALAALENIRIPLGGVEYAGGRSISARCRHRSHGIARRVARVVAGAAGVVAG